MTVAYKTKTTAVKTNLVRATCLAALLMGGFVLTASAADDSVAAPKTATSKVDSAVNKTERVVSDSWITTKVKSEILANSVSKGFKVGVKTKRGVVSLDGKLPTQDAIELVKMIAEKVKGVKSVTTSALVVGG